MAAAADENECDDKEPDPVVVEKTAKALSTSEKVEEEKDDSLITFDDFVEDQVIEELKAIDINTLSPYEAMSFLYNLKKRLQ